MFINNRFVDLLIQIQTMARAACQSLDLDQNIKKSIVYQGLSVVGYRKHHKINCLLNKEEAAEGPVSPESL